MSSSIPTISLPNVGSHFFSFRHSIAGRQFLAFAVAGDRSSRTAVQTTNRCGVDIRHWWQRLTAARDGDGNKQSQRPRPDATRESAADPTTSRNGSRRPEPNAKPSRLVENANLVEPTGATSTATGGRPAALFRFRHEILTERPALGLRVGGGGLADGLRHGKGEVRYCRGLAAR